MILRSCQCALGVFVVSLAGCGGLQSPPNVLNTIWQSQPLAVGGRSLIYASAFGAEHVYVYTYPDGKQVRVLNIGEPSGLCVDNAGNVWVVGVLKIVEFAHGRRKAIATLPNPGYGDSCSIDPTTGNLAVADKVRAGGGRGYLVVYSKATGSPTVYSGMRQMLYCGYDGEGNLFVDGGENNNFKLEELPKGGSRLIHISATQSIGFAGNIQWDGRYLAIEDYSASTIYQFTINGKRATVEGSTQLAGANGGIRQFWVQGDTVLGAIASQSGGGSVGFWKYPGGGSPTKIIPGGTDTFGVAVSK